jgi:AraC-like DNA-binding protein
MRHRVRCATLTGYADVARSCGLDPAALMADVGLDIADLAVPDRWIPAAPVARLLELSAGRSGREDFALLLAERRQLSTLGPLSVALREEPDLRSALDMLVAYEHAYNGALHLRLTESGDLATTRLWLELGEPAPVHQALDLAAAALLGVIQDLLQDDWQPLSACFSHRAPADPGPYARLFGPRLQFEHEFTGLLMRASELDRGTATSDPSLRPYTRQFLESVTSRHEPTLAEQVGDLVEVLLPLGRCSMAQVGRHLGIQPRTLRRQLAEEGESFSSIVQAARARMAEQLLSNDRRSLTEVSRMLGFAAPSAFTRWFRQRFGSSPTQWRESVRSTASGARTSGR